VAIHSVSELTRQIKNLLERTELLRNLLIRGEVSNFKRYESGHVYFTLKDQTAALKCVMFRSRAQHLKFLPQNGMQVVAGGNITVYERDGNYQLICENLSLDGAGELAVAFEQMKARLAAEGLFDAAHKQPLPLFPKTVGVVTSPSGAVLLDIYNVSKRRMPGIRLVLYGVQVQGEAAAEQIAAGIEFFNRAYPADVLIVGRGGGSMEDLWAFNEEPVVRAIFNSRIPVISAVGHETDFTLADFAADVRAPTPSAAAEIAVPNAAELSARVEGLRLRLTAALKADLSAKQARLNRLRQSTMFMYPRRMLENRAQRLDMLKDALVRSAAVILRDKRHQFVLAMEKLDALSPTRVLRRGYGIVEYDGEPLKSARRVKEGDELNIILADGKIRAVVREK